MRTNTFIHYSRSNFLLVQTTVVAVKLLQSVNQPWS